MRITTMRLAQLVAFLAIVVVSATCDPAVPLASSALVLNTSSSLALLSTRFTDIRSLRHDRINVSALALGGRWYWQAVCPRGQFQGAAYIFQRGPNRFSGQLGNTSSYDRGTISGGVVRGRRASFTLNAFGQSSRLGAVIVVTRSGAVQARASYASRQFGRCLLRFYKT